MQSAMRRALQAPRARRAGLVTVTIVLAIFAGVLVDAAVARRGAGAHDSGAGRWLSYTDVLTIGPRAAGADFDQFLPGYAAARSGRGHVRIRGFEVIGDAPGTGGTGMVRAIDVLAVGWPLTSYRARRTEELSVDHWAISSVGFPAFPGEERSWQPAWPGLITNVVLYALSAAALAGIAARALQPTPTRSEPETPWWRVAA